MSKYSKILNYFKNKPEYELVKNELYKPSSNSALNLEEIKIGTTVVPRFLMAFLVRELKNLKIGDTKEISLDFLREGTVLNLRKQDNDTYSGEIIEKGRVIAKMEKRSIPGIGLYLMSTFELYENSPTQQNTPQTQATTQPIVVNVHIQNEQKSEQPKTLKEFLDKRQVKKTEGKIVPLDLKKAQNIEIECDLCGKSIFSVKAGYNGCVCMGADMNSPIKLTKKENGMMYLHFPKKWDDENIELFIKMLYKKMQEE